MTNEFINKTIGIEEDYQMPERLMGILLDEDWREAVFNSFMQEEADLSYDWFTDYYQTEHGDRDRLKQDFSPNSVIRILDGIIGKFETLADICAGTGGLTIGAWRRCPDAIFHCEEVSKRAIPILLFNMAIRGMTGEVVNGDVLSGEVTAVYSLKNKGKYSSIEDVDVVEERQYDRVIMNPPYSLSWNGLCDERIKKYGIPPKSKADYVFVLHGLNLMKDTGKLLAVLPHGVLFRGQGEKIIRENLINEGMISTVIGLPDKLFLNTGIPTCIMELQKKQDGIYFIDASGEFEKQGAHNYMREKHIEAVLSAYRMRRKIDKFSYLANIEEIKRNDYNLNIPRYVDTFETEELPDVLEIFREMQQIERDTAELERDFLHMMMQLTGTDEDTERRLREEEKVFQEYIEGKNGQMELSIC